MWLLFHSSVIVPSKHTKRTKIYSPYIQQHLIFTLILKIVSEDDVGISVLLKHNHLHLHLWHYYMRMQRYENKRTVHCWHQFSLWCKNSGLVCDSAPHSRVNQPPSHESLSTLTFQLHNEKDSSNSGCCSFAEKWILKYKVWDVEGEMLTEKTQNSLYRYCWTAVT